MSFILASAFSLATASVNFETEEKVDMSSGDALCIPFTVLADGIQQNIAHYKKKYLSFIKLFMLHRKPNSLGVPDEKVYLFNSDEKREEHRKAFNDMTLTLYFDFLKILKGKALKKMGQESKAFPYRKGLKSLPNASALYALITYAKTHSRPIGIDWYILETSNKELYKKAKYTVSYKIESGQWIPEKKPTKGLIPFMNIFVVLKKNKPFQDSLFAKIFNFKELKDVYKKKDLSEPLYQLAALADWVDFTSISPQIAESVENYVTKCLPLKRAYQEAHRLYELMNKNDDYKNDDNTLRIGIELIRLNHAFLAKMSS